MANYCYYSMCVIGNKDGLEEFIKVIKADYNYGTMEFSYDRHLFRVFEADDDEIEEIGPNLYQVIISGNCAWSVASCMFDNHSTSYYSSLKRDYPDAFRGTTLPLESERLNLRIEVFSEECGMEFQEHYVIINGEVIVDECVDYSEYCLEEFATKEDAEEELDIEITDEEWETEEYIKRGGFESWDFGI